MEASNHKEEEDEYPKAWGELSPENKLDYLTKLSNLYQSNELTDAKIETQIQIGMNLMKGQGSSEEFLFSENLFSISKSDNVEKFSQQMRSLQQNYDESTCIALAESGYVKNDKFPEIRGLLHIQKEIEQKLLSTQEDRSNLLVVLWSTQCPNLEDYLSQINSLTLEIKQQCSTFKCLAINIDRIFLYNETIQKILIDKVNVTFLRDSNFSQVNNLFATRFVRNVRSAASTTPFIIVADSQGVIQYAQPKKSVDKLGLKLKALILDNKKEAFTQRIKEPFIYTDSAQFQEKFNSIVEYFHTFLATNEEQYPNLRQILMAFPWKGIIVLNLRRYDASLSLNQGHKASFIINLKAKSNDLKIVKELLDKKLEEFKGEGFYFKFNVQEIPIMSVKCINNCEKCNVDLQNEQQYILMNENNEQTHNYCYNCASRMEEPQIFASSDRHIESLIAQNVVKRDMTKRFSATAVQCDACKSFFDSNRYKCAYCSDFDLCERCFDDIEIEGEQRYDDEFEQCSAHQRGKHPFWVVKDFKSYEFI
ncbi:UNKNOWN [Stylonychia lemnae]|uniref:ZZ-type domain-containing protein n=1 Tax=Stylonychia lemnae TaxID=5949 RepID=A0A078AV75_STYLE|nr:UNKNOWN [Stylonychia lemnae]|eukprot:CDW86104.1 UNKNOWN [Stylonychia lemnae]